MSSFKIGIMTESFHIPLTESLKKARDMNVDGIQICATTEELPFDKVTKDQLREYRKMIGDYGLTISAVCGDFGGHGFSVEADNAVKIDKSKRVVDLTLEMGANIITTHIGVVPADTASKKYAVIQEACNQLAEYANKCGAFFAIETGPETAQVLKGLLDSLSTKGVGVNLDPANLIMVTGDDPVQAVYTLKDYIVHTHAKDGVMVQKSDPQVVYDFFAEGGIGDLRLGDYFTELPLGQGHVDFDNYIKALREIGYKGFLTVEREVGPTPEDDIRLAVDFLRKYV